MLQNSWPLLKTVMKNKDVCETTSTVLLQTFLGPTRKQKQISLLNKKNAFLPLTSLQLKRKEGHKAGVQVLTFLFPSSSPISICTGLRGRKIWFCLIISYILWNLFVLIPKISHVCLKSRIAWFLYVCLDSFLLK